MFDLQRCNSVSICELPTLVTRDQLDPLNLIDEQEMPNLRTPEVALLSEKVTAFRSLSSTIFRGKGRADLRREAVVKRLGSGRTLRARIASAMVREEMAPRGVLETCLYADDLVEAERFYGDVLGLKLIGREAGRHVFFRCGQGVLLIFDPRRTSTQETSVGGAKIPLHGAYGAGHVAFAVPEEEFDAWRERLARCGIEVESEVNWPRGGRSLYVRDPAGNSVELATPHIWGVL